MTLRVATYNVHGCVGRGGRRDEARVLDVLRQLDADVLALQELQWDPGEALHLLARFAEALHYRAIPGATLLNLAGHYGNALLTRLQPIHVDHVDITYDDREPRGAIDACLAHDGGEVRVIATHLGLRPAERRAQMRRLLQRLQKQTQPAVLMGDLNEWFLWGRPLRWLHRHFGHAPALPTFPSRLPLFALDRIWVLPCERLMRLTVCRTSEARAASDHLPLLGEIDMQAPVSFRTDDNFQRSMQ